MPNEIDILLQRAEANTPEKKPRKKPTDQQPGPSKEATDASARLGGERPRADRYILGFYIALCAISVVELYSASSREVTGSNVFAPLIRHAIMLVMGIAICMGVSRLKMSTLVRATPAFVLISVLMMIYVLINGQIINGARRSFSLVGIQIQPSELLKISSVLVIAYIMARNQIKGGGVKTRGVVLSAGIVICFGGLLFSQGLTNTLLLMAISMSMMVIGGIEWRKFLMVMVFYGLIGAGGVMYKMHSGDDGGDTTSVMTEGVDANGNRTTVNRATTVWAGRMSRYFSDSIPKWEQPINALNRQEMYSYMAQANGGVLGVLPGNSRETARLPLAFSDYIYSIVVEDWGFVGGFLLLVIYLSLLLRAGAIAWRCDRVFAAMLEMGMAVMIVFQALFHMAITTGVFPVSGQTLPMISKGGTSMLVTSLAFGIMLCVSRYVNSTKIQRTKGAAAQADDLPAAIDAPNINQSTQQ